MKLTKKTIFGFVVALTASANAQTIKNDVFWNTADGRPLYSQGGGIFK